MSKTLDERIVSMKFDNKNFESNVQESMTTLDKLKKALNFKGATSGLEAVDQASKKVNFSGMQKAVDEVGIRFSALQVVATTALANITSSVVNAGKQMLSALTVQPLTSGFQEYETQIGSIQTILSNTRWQNTSLEQVNSALDELNTYADKTIYNFTEMTRNIGTFTAAGVGLDQSVSAIKGIANLAAVSGSTSAQASTAMYQLSQALAAGRVSLMDWNSVVNAGMGGKVFQDALKRTAENLGINVDAMIEKYGSFRESLTRGQWLTTEVLTETLAQISGAYTEADLLAKGYTKEQAAEIVALAKDAEGAATNVRTFTQLIDTTMEALGSGWTNTWELIIGDFNEAQQLWTDISNYLNDVVGQSADARNNLLQGWRDLGGREAMLEGLKNVFNALLSVIEPIKEAFSEIFPPVTAEGLTDLTNKFKDFTAGLTLSETASKNLKSVFKGLFSFVKMVGTGIQTLIDFLGNFSSAADGAFDFLGNLAVTVGDFFTTLNQSMQDGTAFNQIVSDIGTAFGEAASGVGDFLSSGVGKLGEIINGITPDQINTFLNALATGVFVGFIKNLKDNISDLGSETETVSETIVNVFKGLTGGISDSVVGVLDAVRDSLVAWQENIKSTALLKIGVAVALLANAVAQMAALDPQALRDSLGAITVLFGELILTMTAFEKLTAGLSLGMTGAVGLIAMAAAINILASALIKVSGLDTDAITRGVEGIAQLAAIMVIAAKVLAMGGTPMKGAVQLVIMAAALKLLASVVNDLAALNMDQMSQGLEGVGVLLAEIAAFDAWVNGGASLMSSAVAMIFVGAAMKILASSVSDLGNMDTGKAVQGVIAMGFLFGEIAALSHLVDGKTLLQSFIPLMAIAGAMYMLAHVLTEIGQLDGTQVANSVGALGIVLGEIVAFIAMLPNDTKKLSAVSGAMPLLATSLILLAAAINLMSGLNLEQVGTAIVGFIGAMGSLFVGIKAVSGNEKSVAILMVAATALVAMAAALKLLSTIGVVGVAVSLASLAGTFIILGTATKLLGPMAPQMFKIAAAIAAFGGSLIAIGVGSTAIILGLSVSMTALVTTLANLQGTISQLDPAATAIALGILVAAFVGLGVAAYVLSPFAPVLISMAAAIAAFGLSCAAVAGSIWLIVAAFSALGNMSTEGIQTGIDNFTALILGVVDMLPELVVGIMNSLKSLLLGALDVLVELAPQMADSFLKVITEVLASLNEYGPQIIDFVLSFLIQIIDGVAARVPELVGSISNLLSSLFTAIFDAMTGWTGTEGGTDAALSFLIGATGLVVALNAIKGMIPGAIQGAALMAIFIAEIGAILAAFGAIQQLTGVSELINSGGDLLQSIGTALGQFVGGFVGGAVEGATSTLPQVGVSLSQFAVNVTPFLTAMSMVDQSTIDGVTNLALAIAALAGANFADAVSEFLSGGQDFGDLGAKLIPFGEAMVQFSNTVSGIDVEAVNASAACGEALAALATSLPKEGGLAQAIFGESVDMGTFATQMLMFGMALRMYAMAVSGVDFGPVQESAVAGQALSDLASTLPKEGGLAQAIFGENVDMATFGSQMLMFGLALKLYAGMVKDLDVESIQASAQAGQALSDLANALPDSGGLVSWIFGDSDLGSFGSTLVQFGDALKDYAGSLEEVDFERIRTATTSIKNLALVASDAINMDTSGIENIQALSGLGEAIAGYWNNISTINMEDLASSAASLTSLRDLVTSLVGIDTSGIGSFTSALESLGQASLDGLVSVFQNASLSDQGFNLAQSFADGFQQGSQNLAPAAQSIVEAATSALTGAAQDFNLAGLRDATEFATGIQNGAANVNAQVGIMVQNAADALNGYEGFFYAAGSNLAVGFANGISASSYRATLAARAMANAAKTAAESALQEHSPSKVMQRIGEFAGKGFVIGIENYVDASAEVGGTMAEAAISAASKAAEIFSNFGDLDAMVVSLRDLSEALDTSKKDEKENNKETEEATENQSKLSEALSSVADSVEELVDRRNDLSSLNELLNRTGVAFSEGFIAELMSSEGQYAGALSEMVNLTDEQLQALNDVYDRTEVVETMEDMFQTIADSIDNLNKRRKNLRAISSLLKRTGVTFSDNFVKEIMSSSGEYADSLYAMTDLTDDQLQKIADIYEENALLDQIQTVIDALVEDDGLADAFTYSGKSIQSFVEDVNDFGISIDDAIDKMSEFADSVSDGFSKMELEGQTTLEEFMQNLENNWIVAKDWETNVNKVFSQISWSPLSEGFRKAVLEGGFEQWGQIMEDLANSSQEEIYGFLQLWDYMQREGAKMSSNVANSLITGDFEKSGTQIAQGVANGVENGISNVTSAATLMCSSTENTVKDYFGIHSPSTLMYQVGEYMVQGLVNGIVASATELDKAFTLVNQAINFLQQLGDQGIEIQVKVTPVIDTSTFSAKLAEVQTSMGFDTGSVLSNATLNTIDRVASQLGQNGSKRAGSELVGAVAKLSEKIDSIDPSNFGVTYQQNNYSPKALSTAEIYRKTKSQISRYRVNNSNGGSILR